jgi:hypothetical protein
VQPLERILRIAHRLGAARQPIELAEVGVDVQRRILAARDRQRGAREVDLGVGPRDLELEPRERRVFAHQQPGAW